MEKLNQTGTERFTQFATAQGKLQAMMFFLTVSISSVAGKNLYTDEELNAIKKDIQDLRDATEDWVVLCEALVRDWEALRQEREHADDA